MRNVVRSEMACLFGAWLLSVPVALHAQLVPPASNDIKLQVTKQEIDEDAAGRPEISHVESIAKQFKIDPHLVEDLRAGKQGWGEITIRLVLAQQVCKLGPNSCPDLVQVLRRIGELRMKKQSWGEIAKQFGIDLAPAVGEAQRARQELRAKAKTNAEADDRRGAGGETRGRRD